MRRIIPVLIIFLFASTPALLATDSGNHYGWDKYPGTDTAVTGGVTVGGTTVPLDIPILTTDWTQNVDPVTGDVSYSWSLANPVDITVNGQVVATINTMGIVADFDPYVRLSFSADAFSTATFNFNSTVVSFPTINNPLAYASAGLTLTADSSGPASVTGAFAGESYKAMYNGTPITFDTLVGNFGALAEETTVNSDRSPFGSGWTSISGAVSSIQSQFSFTLTPGDSVSGTSRFEIKVPEPATMALLGLGSLLMLRKRNA